MQDVAEYPTELSVHRVSQVVYSACSVYIQESETVVKAALAENIHKFSVMKGLPNWSQRGLSYLDLDIVRVRPSSMASFVYRRGLRLRHKCLGRRRTLQ
jgi:16S rRNA C967 or C1407 C5-methylase (RsmB/RsmF family)